MRGTNTAVRSRHPSRASPVPSRTRVVLHFISSSRSVLMEIKATCQQPAEYACIINHGCGFLLFRKIYYRDQKERVIKGNITLHVGGGGLYAHKLGRKSEMFWLYANALLCMFEAKKRSVKTNIFCRLPSDPQIRHVQMYAVYLRELFVSLHSRFLFLPLSLF